MEQQGIRRRQVRQDTTAKLGEYLHRTQSRDPKEAIVKSHLQEKARFL